MHLTFLYQPITLSFVTFSTSSAEDWHHDEENGGYWGCIDGAGRWRGSGLDGNEAPSSPASEARSSGSQGGNFEARAQEEGTRTGTQAVAVRDRAVGATV